MRQAAVAFAFAVAFGGAIAQARAIEINSATQAELESVTGIGVAMSSAILAERTLRPFDDWADFTRRVRGAGNAARRSTFSDLTVKGAPYPGAARTAAGTATGTAASAP